MRTIGLLGGMSWESTAEYYRVVNEAVRDRLGGLHSAPVVLASVDFAGIAALQSAGRWDEAGRVLGGHAAGLVAAGAEGVLICTNTMHLVADQVAEAAGVPLLHLVDVVAAAARRVGARRVGLLGTAFTMEEPFYADRLAAHGLEVVVPDAADRSVVHRVIFDELVRGVVRAESREAYRAVIASLVARRAEAVVLGCTEIELLVGQEDSAVPVLPTTRLHAEAAVAWAVDGVLPPVPSVSPASAGVGALA
jgi:aspartate racemase